MPDRPEIMYDEDGAPIAILGSTARSPADAVRRLVEDHGCDWYLDHLPGHWNEDEDEFRIDTGPLRRLVAGVAKGWMRPAETDDERTGFFGDDAWYWCAEDHPAAVAYWQVGG